MLIHGELNMRKDKNGCGFVDLICYQCSGGNYKGMDNHPKGCMEYVNEHPENNKRTHVYVCRDCNYRATYSNKYVGDYVIQIR